MGEDARTAHARINFYMNIHLHARFLGRSGQGGGGFFAPNGLDYGVLGQNFSIFRLGIAQDEKGLGNAGFP
ncbi:hypothetical protein SDC9_208351 [bioreactor metagenome]|uniref:Uncharacterized protein n=1 Tax=bioreactor metagenome TaxID=1076179 RepID=A0A645JBU1_9ZZZZ